MEQNEKYKAEEAVCQKARDLSNHTDMICKKIEKQTEFIESVRIEAENEMKRFEENQVFFNQSLEKLKNDGRNTLIILLLIIVMILSGMLKSKH